MKRFIGWITLAGMILALAARVQAATYTVNAVPGWNLFVNQLDAAKDNNIRNVLPRVGIGSQVRHFNLATKTFDVVETYQQLLTGAQTWVPGTTVLNVGEGFYFFNPGRGTVDLVFSGDPHAPKLPINIGNGAVLVGSQTAATATVEQILGFKPTTPTAVYRFIAGSGHDPTILDSVNYTVYAAKGFEWFNPPGVPPAFRVGESVWITTNGTPPAIERHPTGQTTCPGGKVGFTVAAFGTPPLTYQWLLDGKPIAGATSPTYSIEVVAPTQSGSYTVQVTNPFGSVTSNPAKLVAEDTVPPVLACPTNIITSCRGLGGTQVTFQIGIADNCDRAPVATAQPLSGSLFPSGVTTVVVTGTDASGNKSTCSFTVTVVDDVKPQIVCPGNISVPATSSKGARVTFDVVAVDNCDTAPKVECTPASGSVFPLGDTLVTCVATDANGNKDICRFTVTVLDPACCKDKSWNNADVTSPGARFGHTMAYDSARGRVVLFGGEGAQGGFLGDTWEWDGKVWARMAAEGPIPRAHAAMSYDSRIQRVVLHGGRSLTAGILDDTWLWDGSKWQSLLAKSVGGRFNHAMAYDSSRGVTVLHGGSNSDIEVDDTWEFDGKGWKKVFAGTGGPGARQGHAMAYGSLQKQLLLFGGETKSTVNNETWAWDGKTWKLLTKDGPSPRAFHAMAYSDNCDAVVLFGGGANNAYGLGDTWEWNGKAWSQISSGKLSPRGRTAMAHDSARNQTVLFGGTRTLKDWLGDTWLLGLSQAAPQVASVDSTCGENSMIVTFDHAVSASSAGNISNYLLVCGQVPNGVASATLTDDPRIVWLSFSNAITSGCRLTITGVKDGCGRTMTTFQTGIECRTDPCVRGSTGNEYWLTFPGNYELDPTNQPLPSIHIVGSAGTIGTVSIPGSTNAVSVPFSIPAVGLVRVDLPREADLGTATDVVQSNAVHVVASRPVAIYGLNHVPYSTDGYLGLSTRALGTTYFVMAYPNLFAEAPELNGSQFAIAATADDTLVNIVPSATIGSRVAGTSFPITLMRGQTYQLRATNGAPLDLTGTSVVANKPIAVFGGHRSSTVPDTNVFFANHLVEQLPPADTWGTNFFTLSYASRSNGDLVRVMALLDGTLVRSNGVAVGPLVNRGKFIEFKLAASAQISSDKPVLVAQYSMSSDYDGVLNADPFVVIVSPANVYSSSYVIPGGGTNFPSNFLNIIVPKAGLSSVVLDGVTLSPTLFSVIGSGTHFGARVAVGQGAHAVAAGGNPIGVTAYGWSLYNAYGFPGQTCATTQAIPVDFKCPPNEVVLRTGPNCLAIIPDFTKELRNSPLALSVTQDPPEGTAVLPGSYTVRIVVVDVFGVPHICRVFVSVTSGTASGLLCPSDIVTNCVSTAGQYVFFAPSICNANATIKTVPESGSFFPVGTTKVEVTANGPNGVLERCTFSVTVNCPGVISISTVGDSSTIDWSGPAVFQRAPTPNGPWVTIPDVRPPFRVIFTQSAEFFRVLQ